MESRLEAGSYYLTNNEKAMLDQVSANFDNIVVIMNVGNVVDMEWLDTYPKIDSVLFAWQGGMEAGNAVADVLSGDETPSGKMAATIAKTYQDYPSSANFGKSDYTNYIEDIYVGYRYFETFTAAKDRVKYGFGFGLSYTTFDIVTNSVTTRGEGAEKEIVVDVTVKNTGSVKGKEVIQIYYGAPQGQLGKAAKSLAAYAKTNLLQPGGQETIQISFKVDGMASYDDAGVTGKKSAYVMEAGDYPIYVGNSVRESVQKGVYNEPALRVTQQLEEALSVYPASRAFNRLRPAVDGNTVTEDWTDLTPTRSYDLAARITSEMAEKSPDLPYGQTNRGLKLIDVYRGNCTMDEYIAQMSLQNLADLCRGAGACPPSR